MIFHCCMELDKVLELTLKGQEVLNIGETETYRLVREYKARGLKYFASCDNVDAEGRCVGHAE